MKHHTIAVLALIALLATTGAATAMPGDAAMNQADHDSTHNGSATTNDSQSDHHNTNQSSTEANREHRENAESTSHDPADHQNENAQSDAGRQSEATNGPTDEMPENVPDHVVEIHQTIRDFLNGEIDDDLGQAISGLDPAFR